MRDFRNYTSSQELYQSFELTANYVSGKTDNPMPLARGTRLVARFYVGSDYKGSQTYTVNEQRMSLRLDFPEGVRISQLVSYDPNIQDENLPTIQLRAVVTMEYTDQAILDQFKPRNDERTDDGTRFDVKSYLAYTERALPNSTIRASGTGGVTYYRSEFKTASLNYYSCDEKLTESEMQLGINGKEVVSKTIYSHGSYNVSAVEESVNAKSIQLKLTLERRSNSVEQFATASYTQVSPWADYLSSGVELNVSYQYVDSTTDSVKTKTEEVVLSDDAVKDDTLTAVIMLPDNAKLDSTSPIQIGVTLNVLTGSGFEAKNLTYANYKIVLEAELLRADNDLVIGGTRAEDYIVYTNAKICLNPIKP